MQSGEPPESRRPLAASSTLNHRAADWAAQGPPDMGTSSEATLSSGHRLADDVRRDLQASPKRLQPRYLYDALGSKLFEAICELPEYRITRSELHLLTTHGAAIGAGMSSPLTVVELGGGNGEKLAVLLSGLVEAGVDLRVELVDVSATALELAARTLARFPTIRVTPHQTTYEAGLQHIGEQRVAEGRPGGMLVAFLGSNIGNLDPSAARRFLTMVRGGFRSGDRLVLGTDLVKPESELVAAYDDALGVTAAFNKNLLVRLNRELGANFDLDRFAHRAVWNAAESRVEMHLESLRAQAVSISGTDCAVAFAAGESIWTESSYKYESVALVALGAELGLARHDQWVDEDAHFAVTAFNAA